jgi:hypothetical protein
LVVPLLAAAASALLPPLGPYTYQDGERRFTVQTPLSWHVEQDIGGLRMTRQAGQEVLGTVVLGFRELDKPISQDAFLDAELAPLAARYGHFKVLSRTAPEGEPRVRLAALSFTCSGFACRGYVMTCSGDETGTVGFAFAESVTARQLGLEDLVPLIVAGSYDAHAVRGADVAQAQSQEQSTAQVMDRLYGDAGKDFKNYLDFEQKHNKLFPTELAACSTFQPILRDLKGFLIGYLNDRAKERVAPLKLFCVPTKEFNAFCQFPTADGPGYLCFHAELLETFAHMAQEYTYLRERKLPVEQFGTELTAYTHALAEAVLSVKPLPAAGAINFYDPAVSARYTRVFRSMMGVVVAHEMAHNYLHHFEAGGTNEALSIQQREVAADTAGLANIETAADKSDLWEGGAIHAFAMLAQVDADAAQHGSVIPEWARDHPYAIGRLRMAEATLGPDDFKRRHDPWNAGGSIEPTGEGVEVVTETTFTHPQSHDVIKVPAGWVGAYDAASGVFQMRPGNADGNLPLAAYGYGGTYASAQAIVDDMIADMRKSMPSLKVDDTGPFKTGNPNITAAIFHAFGTLGGEQVGVIGLGLQTAGGSHSLLLITPVKRYDADAKVFDGVLGGLAFSRPTASAYRLFMDLLGRFV